MSRNFFKGHVVSEQNFPNFINHCTPWAKVYNGSKSPEFRCGDPTMQSPSYPTTSQLVKLQRCIEKSDANTTYFIKMQNCQCFFFYLKKKTNVVKNKIRFFLFHLFYVKLK